MPKKSKLPLEVAAELRKKKPEKYEKVFALVLLEKPLSPTQQEMYDRYRLIVNLKSSGFTGRLLIKQLEASPLFKELSEARLNSIITEVNAIVGKFHIVDKKAERIFLAQQYDEVALKSKSNGNYELFLKFSDAAAKLKGLYQSDDEEPGRRLPETIVLESGAKAVKNLLRGYVDTVEDAENDELK